MIKKLFTLLTLALLAMPLTWGDPTYYLIGNFNSWGDTHQFASSDGITFTLNNVSITENTPEFKIKKVDGNTVTIFGGEGGTPYILHHGHHTGIDMKDGGNEGSSCQVFKMQSAGTTNFSFQIIQKTENNVTYYAPGNLCVNRDPKLYIKGNFNNWTEEAMTATSTGWTIAKYITQNQQFGFVDEFGQWQAWSEGNYGINGINGTIPIKPGDTNFQMNVASGNYIINVNSAVNGMDIYDNNSAEEKSLSEIQSSGVVGKPYKVNEALQVVYFDSTKDFAIARNMVQNNTDVCPSTAIDYMRNGNKPVQANDWNDNNWVMLDLSDVTGDLPENFVNGIIAAGALKGVYTDNNNYTIKVSGSVTCSTGTAYTPNVYCPANFYSENIQQITLPTANGGTETKDYWFKTPRVMEVFTLTWALWYNSDDNVQGIQSGYQPGFYMERGDYHLKGGIGADISYNSKSVALTSGASYEFLTVAMKGAGTFSGTSTRGANTTPVPAEMYPESSYINPSYKVAPLNLDPTDPNQVITGVSEVKSGSEVVSVTYCDLAGRMSQKPFAGVNIIVTRYSDGSTTTQKVIR